MPTQPKNDWPKLGDKLARKLDGIADEAQIKKLVIDAINQIIDAGVTLKRPLGIIRKQIKAKFPKLPATQVKPDGYYFTKTGLGRIERFEHLALWYLTENTERWSVTPHFSQTVRSLTAKTLQDKGCTRAKAQFPDPTVCRAISTQNY